MTVYFIRRTGDATGLIKIGHTSNLSNRLSSFRMAIPEGIEILATCDGGPEVEKRLHALAAADRVKGEWFKPSDQLMSLIEVAKCGGSFGQIPDVSPRPKRDVKSHSVPGWAPDYIRRTMLALQCDAGLALASYCLTELTIRAQREAMCSLGDARDKVCDLAGVPRSMGRRIAYRSTQMQSVSAAPMINFARLLAQTLRNEGTPDSHLETIQRVLAHTTNELRKRAEQGSGAGTL